MAFSLLSFKGLVGLLIVVGRTLVSALVDVPSVEDYVRRTSARGKLSLLWPSIDANTNSPVSPTSNRPWQLPLHRRRYYNPARKWSKNEQRLPSRYIITSLPVTQCFASYPSNNIPSVNSTLSIPLASSWTPSTVAISAIPKTGPIKNNVYLWTDASTKSFYSFGGQWLGGRNITSSALWKFTADDSGGGIWSLQAPSNANLFKQLHPTEYGIFANTPTTGFVLGGDASPSTELDRTVRQSIPGMVAFNMDTKVWQNGTAGFSPLPASTVVYRGAAHYVPSFNGPNGLILIMGGFHMQMDDPRQTGQTANFFDLGNLTFFDPETKKTYWQSTTGDIPETPRSGFCVAGFRDEQNGSYEIFLLGGRNERDRFPYQNAYVLSLPGFVWRRLPDLASGPRFDHTCVAVGGRQILSIGGYTGQRWEKDEAPQGLLLFDAAEWKWKDKYEPDAGAYLRNEEIGRWYANG